MSKREYQPSWSSQTNKRQLFEGNEKMDGWMKEEWKDGWISG
jgi:hypothetical protein